MESSWKKIQPRKKKVFHRIVEEICEYFIVIYYIKVGFSYGALVPGLREQCGEWRGRRFT